MIPRFNCNGSGLELVWDLEDIPHIRVLLSKALGDLGDESVRGGRGNARSKAADSRREMRKAPGNLLPNSEPRGDICRLGQGGLCNKTNAPL